MKKDSQNNNNFKSKNLNKNNIKNINLMMKMKNNQLRQNFNLIIED